MTSAAGGLEVCRASLRIGLQLGEVGVAGDDFSAVRVGTAKYFVGACGQSGLLMGGQSLLMRGADLAGGQGVLFQRIE